MSAIIGKQAIVIGSSMAGLTAAHVLSKHFDHVVVIERDQLTGAPEARAGVPQGRQPHGLLVRGQMILESYFPGLVQELLAAGAVPVNMGSQFQIFMFGKWRPIYHSNLVGTSCSRPLLESTVYRRVAKNPKIEFITHAEVIDLCADAARRQVIGVYIRRRHHTDKTEPTELTLSADIVVDASGRDSHADQWLGALGFEPPKETVVNAQPGYAARIYEVPSDFKGDWTVLYAMPSAPGGKRGGIIMGLEGNRWHVCMVGMGGDYPPTDENAFLAFARSLPTPAIYEAIKNAKPISPILGYRRAENRLRRFHEMPRYLEGFVALGDSVYALNPVYGQGMTVAAIASTVLDACLLKQTQSGALTGFAQSFQKRLSKVIAGPWQLATNEDLRWIENAPVDRQTRMIQGYVEQVLQTMMTDQTVAEAFLKVQNMVEEPTSLFRPAIMARVLGRQLKRRGAQEQLAAASL